MTSGSDKKGLDVTFFVPCLNEEKNVIPAVETILSAIKNKKVSFEILVYDDHSSDKTLTVIAEYKKKHPKIPVRIIACAEHRGLISNYADSAFKGKGKYLIIVPGDDDVPAAFIERILGKLHTADVIAPYFEDDIRHGFRRHLSRAYTKLMNFASGYPLKYYNAAVHLRTNVMLFGLKPSGNGFLAELLVRVLNRGATWTEVAVPMRKKKTQVISVSFSLKNVLSVAGSLLRIFGLRLSKDRKPGKRLV